MQLQGWYKKCQWTDYTENILNLIKVDSDIAIYQTRVPALNLDSFTFHICDISLPQCKTGFVNFLIANRTMDYTYIGECKFIQTRLHHYNSGHGSTLTIPANKRPFAIMGYICGFDGKNKALRQQLEKQCKEKSDCLICEGNIDPRIQF